jgi:putative redox protein
MAEDLREVVAVWAGESAFNGRNPAGCVVQMGSLKDQPGISPMELLLMGVAGCTGMDVVSILGKKRQTIEKFEIMVRGKRAEAHPRVYTEIEVVYYLWGDDLDPKKVEEAIHLSEEKYCSASAMLAAVAQITFHYFIHPAGELLMTV